MWMSEMLQNTIFLNACWHRFGNAEIRGLLNNTPVDIFLVTYYETVVRYYETESRVQTPAHDNSKSLKNP